MLYLYLSNIYLVHPIYMCSLRGVSVETIDIIKYNLISFNNNSMHKSKLLYEQTIQLECLVLFRILNTTMSLMSLNTTQDNKITYSRLSTSNRENYAFSTSLVSELQGHQTDLTQSLKIISLI